MLKQFISLQTEGCLPQNLLSPLLNTLFHIKFQVINWNIFLANQIVGFCDHQYRWKEIISILDFLHGDSYWRKISSKSAAVVSVDEVLPQNEPKGAGERSEQDKCTVWKKSKHVLFLMWIGGFMVNVIIVFCPFTWLKLWKLSERQAKMHLFYLPFPFHTPFDHSN